MAGLKIDMIEGLVLKWRGLKTVGTPTCISCVLVYDVHCYNHDNSGVCHQS